MNPIDAWKESVRKRMVPAAFSVRVMAALTPVPSLMERLWTRPAIRVATWLLAGVALAARLVAAFALFVAS